MLFWVPQRGQSSEKLTKPAFFWRHLAWAGRRCQSSAFARKKLPKLAPCCFFLAAGGQQRSWGASCLQPPALWLGYRSSDYQIFRPPDSQTPRPSDSRRPTVEDRRPKTEHRQANGPAVPAGLLALAARQISMHSVPGLKNSQKIVYTLKKQIFPKAFVLSCFFDDAISNELLGICVFCIDLY